MHLVWFHFLHSISSLLRNREQKNVTGWECAPIDVWGIYWWRWDGGVMARRKVSKSAQIIFNNQQGLVGMLEGSGGVVQMGGDAD